MMMIDRKDRILRVKEVCRLLGVSQPTLWRMGKRGELPKKRKISPGAVGYLRSEIYDMFDLEPEIENFEEAKK